MDNQRINNFLHDVGESESLLINAYEAKNNKSDNRRFVNALKTGALSLAMVTGANVHSASLTDVFLQLGNKVLEQIQAPSLDNKLDQEINASAQALMQFVNRFTTEENMSKSENLHYVAKKLNELSSYTSNESYKDWYEKASSSLGKLSVLVEQQGDMNGLANSQEVNGLLAEIAGLQLSESAPNIVLLDEYDEHALRSIASQFNNNYYTAVQVAQAKEHTTTTYKDLVSNCLTHGFASSIAGQINSNPDLKANSAFKPINQQEALNIARQALNNNELKATLDDMDNWLYENENVLARHAVAAYCADPSNWQDQLQEWQSLASLVNDERDGLALLDYYASEALHRHAAYQYTMHQAVEYAQTQEQENIWAYLADTMSNSKDTFNNNQRHKQY